jgi:hypothetical protein
LINKWRIGPLAVHSWVRVAITGVSGFIVLAVLKWGIAQAIIQPLEADIVNARRGINRSERDMNRLKKEVSALQNTVEDKKNASLQRYQHYYTLYTNSVRYINQFVLVQSKPPGLLITTSSVVPNLDFTILERRYFEPHLKQLGVSRLSSLSTVFSITKVTLTTSGSFNDTGQFLSNLFGLPIDFSVRHFMLQESGVSITMTLELGFVVYRMD